MCAIGAFVTIGLWALQIPLAGTLGILAALMTFIPNLGPLLSVLPAALLAFASGPSKGLMTISLFALAHFFEGNLVTPLAERNIVKLPPVLTLTMQLLLATLTGFAGLALAAPFTAAMLGAAHVLLPEPPENTG
jgi:predicted PurR-regulated permease PerM